MFKFIGRPDVPKNTNTIEAFFGHMKDNLHTLSIAHVLLIVRPDFLPPRFSMTSVTFSPRITRTQSRTISSFVMSDFAFAPPEVRLPLM